MTIPTISVVTVVYNDVSHINETIESVLGQNRSSVEYIIIDGGSTDGTVDIIKKHATKIAYWISQPDYGIYDAMNKGIDIANGDWIIFMNSGDSFASRDTLASVFSQRHDADILYGDAIVRYPSFETVFPKTDLEKMWKRMPFCHQATFVRTSVMKAYKFDLRYALSSDYNFLYTAHKSNLKFSYVNKVICSFNYVDGASRNRALQSLDERRKIILSESFNLVYWIHYFCLRQYIVFSIFIKKVFGNRLTEWVTRLLRA